MTDSNDRIYQNESKLINARFFSQFTPVANRRSLVPSLLARRARIALTDNFALRVTHFG
jgi:hypothetical protein